MQNVSEIESRIKEMLVERLFLKVAPSDIPGNAKIMDEYGVDSVALLELVVGLEEEFGIVVEDGDFDISNFSTPAALAAFVAKRLDA